MLPTQFIPKYYSDNRDILNAADHTEPKQEESAPRRSFFAFILGLLRRSEPKSEETVVSQRERFARP